MLYKMRILLLLSNTLALTIAVCPPNQHDVKGDGSQCCNHCPKGEGVVSSCSHTNDTICQACVAGLTYSHRESRLAPCMPCTRCVRNSHMTSSCNVTHDTLCECDSHFFYNPNSNKCHLCMYCFPGYGVTHTCTPTENTQCTRCANGTYSDVASAIAPCVKCSVCGPNQREMQECSDRQDTVCLEMSLQALDYPLQMNEHSQRRHRDSNNIDVIPIYCALLGAVVVGLLGYVIFKNVRRSKGNEGVCPGGGIKQSASNRCLDNGEYTPAVNAGDSGVYVETEIGSVHSNTRYSDLPVKRRKDVEKCLSIQREGSPEWTIVGKSLGLPRSTISEILGLSHVGSADPVKLVLSEWSKQPKSTVGQLSKVLTKLNRADVVQVLHGCTTELTPLYDCNV